MNSTVTSSSLGAPRITRLKLWAGVVAAAMAATAVQIAFYGAPSFFGFGAYHVASAWVTLAALAWAVGPALLALVAGLWRVASFRRRSNTKLSASDIAVVILLALVSAYLGIFVAFNVWGT